MVTQKAYRLFNLCAKNGKQNQDTVYALETVRAFFKVQKCKSDYDTFGSRVLLNLFWPRFVTKLQKRIGDMFTDKQKRDQCATIQSDIDLIFKLIYFKVTLKAKSLSSCLDI